MTVTTESGGRQNAFPNETRPYIDEGDEHIVVLYYVVDSDGDTVIYNERTESLTYTEKQRVTPKQGRVVIFEGGQYHTAEQPTKGTRCIVNYNLDYYYD